MSHDTLSPATATGGAATNEPAPIWAVAAAVAAFGAWVLYDALPGINWVLWTGAATAGLVTLTIRRHQGNSPRAVIFLGAVPVVIAGAAAVTASPHILALVFLAVVLLLAMQMLLATGPSTRSITVRFAAAAPLVALRTAVIEAARRGVEATSLVGSARAREWIRAIAITLPVVLGFAALLAGADPVFAEWRDAVGQFMAGWEFVPRLVFFVALLVIVSERYGRDDGRGRALRFFTFAVIAAVLLLLASAFRRVWLYEDAYGFTTARLYAQVYMCAVAAGVVVLSLEVAGKFDAGRLFRRAAAAVTILFVVLIYWNHEGWMARRNMDRFASTGKLDVAYLARELSPDAIPAVAERLHTLPEPLRSELRRAVWEHSAAPRNRRQRAWFEWNLARARAWRALDRSFAPTP